MKKKQFLMMGLCAMLTAGAAGTMAQAKDETAKLNLAYQYGLAYAPLIVAQENGMIEAAYKEATGKELTVTWTQMNSGADINTGIASGDLQAGFMGVAPAITGVTSGLGYKIFTNISGQEHGLMTSDPDVNELADLVGTDKQVALVNNGSIQHIILARALDHAGFDAHALDANLVILSHPDGMASLVSGSLPCHLTTNPYLYQERDNADLHEVSGISDVWTAENSFIVGIASETLKEDDPELYQALCDAVAEAIDFINENPEEAAAITCEYDGNSLEDETEYMQKGVYSTETTGVFELAKFMADNAFIENAPEEYTDLVFDNVTGD